MAKTKRYSRPRRNITKKRNVGKKHLGKKHLGKKHLGKKHTRKHFKKKQKSSRRSKRGGNPEEELFNAVKEGDFAEVKHLISYSKKRLNLNQRDEYGRTPLFLVTGGRGRSNLSIASYLLLDGADVNASGVGGYTPLMRAAENGDMDMVRLLLGYGANVNLRNDSGKTAVDIALSRSGGEDIASMIRRKHEPTRTLVRHLGEVYLRSSLPEHLHHLSPIPDKIATLERAIQEGAYVNQPDDKGKTPLYIAAHMGDLEVARVLIEAQANVDQPTKWGSTPLWIAAMNGHLEVVRMLIRAGADVNQSNKKGQTPLIVAIGKGHLSVVRMLIEEGANINKSDGYIFAPLSLAAALGQLEVANELIEAGADVNQPDKDGATPLFTAAEKGSLELMKVLIQYQANVNQPTDNGYTPLLIAAERGRLEVARELIEAGADVNQPNNRGESALYLAVSNRDRNLDIITLLLDANANVYQRVSLGRADSPREIAEEQSQDGVEGARAILDAIRRSRSYKSAYHLMTGNNYWSLRVGVGEQFNLRKSLTLLDSPISFASQRALLLPVEQWGIRVSDANSRAFGGGVTIQWISEFGRALLLNPQIFKTDGYTKKVVISRLSDPNDYYTRKMLYGCGIALALSLMRNEPLGIPLSSSMCKLLLDKADVVDWRDLIDILSVESQWNAVKACMEASNDNEKAAAFQDFNTYVLKGWDEDFGLGIKETYDRFAIPSRESDRAGTSQEVPADRAYSNVVLETGPQPETVNAENVKVFIENWAKKVLVTDTVDQTFLIRQGMNLIAGLSNKVVSLNSADNGLELFQRMIQGSTDINIDAWRAKTQLTHDPDVSPTEAQEIFDIFWRVVGELDNENRVKLMTFWGKKVLPAGGFAALTDDFKLIVRDRCNETEACLPKAATCFLQLKISYPDKADKQAAVKDMIGWAIAQSTGYQLT
jgi:ankyrin repeat protein